MECEVEAEEEGVEGVGGACCAAGVGFEEFGTPGVVEDEVEEEWDGD